MRYVEKETAGILNSHKFINPWLWDRYSVGAYQGCGFRCIYCYAREDKYSRHLDDSDVVYIKKDAAAKLDLRISRSRTLLPDVVGMSGICDPYQDAERTFKATRSCLEVLAEHRWPVVINTKSALVARDLDLLSRIAKDTWANVCFSITTADPAVARFLEPNADPPQARFDAIRRIKSETPGVMAGVAAIPLVPGLEDTGEAIERLIDEAVRSRADYFIFSPAVTLDGRQAVFFLEKLFRNHPDLRTLYEDLYGFQYKGDEYTGTYGPKKSHLSRLNKKIIGLLKSRGMPYRIRRFIPKDYRKTNYLIAEELCNEAYELQSAGQAWTERYWAGMNIQNLKEPIEDVAKRGALREIRNVDESIERSVLDCIP
jgi:DNA repair photolyase